MSEGLPVSGVKLVAENAAGFAHDINQSISVVNTFSNSTTQAADHTSGASQIMIGALRHIGEMAVDVFARAGRAVVGFVKDSINVAGDFESGMNRFSAVAGQALQESGLSLKDFRDQFIQIGKELPVSTSEVQQAAIEMVKGGIEPATVAAGGLRQVIQFAAASDLDLASASTIAAKALGGWVDIAADAKTKAEFLTHSTDLLQKAANASTVDVKDLALGLYNVQGTAKLAGVSFDETVTALAQLAPSFSSSADAGTSFKTFLARLQPTTTPAIAAMEGLGLYTDEAGSAFYDASGKFIGMEKASALLKGSLEGLTDAQRASILQTIFGQDAIRTAAVFAEQGAAGFDNMATAMAKQNDVAEMAKQKQAGFNTALDNAKGSFEALQITIGTAVLPVLTNLLNNVVAPGINIITDLADAGQVSASTFANLSPTMQTIAGVMQSAFGTISTAVDTIHTFIERVIKDVAIWQSGVVGLPTILQSFGISTETAGLINNVLTTLSEGFTTIAEVWTNTLQPALASVGQWLGVQIPVVIAFVNEHWEAFKGALIAVGTVLAGAAVAGAIVGLVGVIGSLLTPINLIIAGVALLGAAWAEDWGGIQTTLTDFWTTTGQPIFNEVVAWLQVNIPAAIQTVSQFWTGTLQPAMSTVWGFIQQNIIPILNVLASVAIAELKVELAVLAGIWKNVLQPALSAVWGFLNTSVIPIISTLVKINIAILKKELELLSAVWNNVLLPALKDVWAFIQANVVPIFDTANTKATGIAKTVRETLGPAFDWLGKNVLQPVVGFFQDIGKAVEGAIKWMDNLASTINSIQVPDWLQGHSPPPMAKWFDFIAESVQVVADDALPGFAEALSDADMGVVALTKSMKQPLVKAIDGLSEHLQASTLIDSASQLGEKLMDALGSGIAEGIDGVMTQLGTANAAIQDALKGILKGGMSEKPSVLGSFSPQGNAVGGPLPAGEAHWVGEQGRELFMPAQHGYILPHDQSMRMTSPPASAAQIQAGGRGGGPTSVTQQRVYQYSPTYAATPRAPAVDFAQMVAFGA